MIQEIFKNSLTLLVADRDEGKSSLLYHFIEEAIKQKGEGIQVYTFGLNDKIALSLGVSVLYTTRELELIKNSFIFIDELNTLFNLENRTNHRQIEQFLRKLAHNNNKVLLCGLARDFKKFVCSSAKGFIYKRVTIGDLINGSSIKKLAEEYAGHEAGQFYIDIDKDKYLFYNGHDWRKGSFTYNPKHDTKKDNKSFFKTNMANVRT